MNRYHYILSVIVLLVAGVFQATGMGDSTRLAFCSDTMVFVISPASVDSSYHEAVIWRLNVRDWDAGELGIRPRQLGHVDECKPLDGGRRLMITSSRDWAAIVDTATCRPVFFAPHCRNAHSIESLPGGLVAVAMSDRGDCVRLYDISDGSRQLDSYGLTSCHGVAWMEYSQRLYAVGDSTMVSFRIEDRGRLVPDTTVTIPSADMHDIVAIDRDRLCVSGRGVFIYDTRDGSWTGLPLFGSSERMKSMNYNPVTGEMWFTDSTDTTAPVRWQSRCIKHTSGHGLSVDDVIDRLDLDDRTLYKIRVISW